MPVVPRAVVLLNLKARRAAGAPTESMARVFSAAGWQVEIWALYNPDRLEAAAREAVARGVSAVFGAGGDGTLSRILPALIGTEVALGVVPLGTDNTWARALDLPLQAERAVAAQLTRPARTVDVGCANGRPFLIVASAGFDASVVRLVEAHLRGFGRLAYLLAGLWLLPATRGVASRVWINEQPLDEMELLAAMATNGGLYGGFVPLVPGRRPDDGALEMVLFAGRSWFHVVTHVARVLLGRHTHARGVTLCQARQMRVQSLAEPLAVQIDGDPHGATPLEVEILPRALVALGG